MKKISFVITSYNRKNIISKSIDSVINQNTFFKFGELIIVDDASTDKTVCFLKDKYSNFILDNKIKIIELKKNLGVTGAKNVGFKESTGDWVIFLDSDDLLVDNCFDEMLEILYSFESLPIIFFRCINELNKFVGIKFENNKILDLEEYLENTSYGEALTAINKRLDNNQPYVTELRGYEGLGCSRLIYKYDNALLSKLIARIYFQNSEDRLSVNSGFLRRMPLLSKGHFLMLKEFGKFMTLKSKSFYFIKAMVYYVVGNIYYFIKGRK
ncbi:glycosyltransferase family 2 protein [Aliarcobacter butzleri]|uniref:glycosyltransferase family 2 protein n=1 Tax=Aliarcobacter butzleri TaxID=28197 RepID=UPI0021B300D0|nr:glycosyltransferase family 2 protein [Aliarcobacter butzleri]MCT7563741.1 glycosyltransferase family 2 protein [Aliarcobacter butzleri]